MYGDIKQKNALDHQIFLTNHLIVVTFTSKSFYERKMKFFS